MNKQWSKISLAIVLTGIFTLLFAIPISANSSWHWLSDAKPFDLLPFAVIATLLIETVSINFIPKIKRPLKVLFIVLIGNILSYAATYFDLLFEFFNNIPYYFNHGINYSPLFNIGSAYLMMTIIIELPFVYILLQKDTVKKKTLIFTIIGVNIITTVLVFVIERFLCYGEW